MRMSKRKTTSSELWYQPSITTSLTFSVEANLNTYLPTDLMIILST